eukprot:11553256-Prorocentrum_lima.AAC.1
MCIRDSPSTVLVALLIPIVFSVDTEQVFSRSLAQQSWKLIVMPQFHFSSARVRAELEPQ